MSPSLIFPSDADIICLLKDNCKNGTMLLYDRYSRPLLLAIRRIVSDKAAAESVLIETFVRACHTKSSNLPEPQKLLTWMMSIAREQADLLIKINQSKTRVAITEM